MVEFAKLNSRDGDYKSGVMCVKVQIADRPFKKRKGLLSIFSKLVLSFRHRLVIDDDL